MQIGDKFEIEIPVPDSARNADGSIKEEFYEFLFGMLGKEYGGATAKSIRIEEA